VCGSHRGPHILMSQELLYLVDGDSSHDQLTGKAMPKVMEANASYSSGADPEPEVMFDPIRVQHLSCIRQEDPLSTPRGQLVLSQGDAKGPGHGDGARPSVLGIRLDMVAGAPCDPYLSALEVDIAPAKCGELPLAHAGLQCGQEEGVPAWAMAVDGGQEGF